MGQTEFQMLPILAAMEIKAEIAITSFMFYTLVCLADLPDQFAFMLCLPTTIIPGADTEDVKALQTSEIFFQERVGMCANTYSRAAWSAA